MDAWFGGLEQLSKLPRLRAKIADQLNFLVGQFLSTAASTQRKTMTVLDSLPRVHLDPKSKPTRAVSVSLSSYASPVSVGISWHQVAGVGFHSHQRMMLCTVDCTTKPNHADASCWSEKWTSTLKLVVALMCFVQAYT